MTGEREDYYEAPGIVYIFAVSVGMGLFYFWAFHPTMFFEQMWANRMLFDFATAYPTIPPVLFLLAWLVHALEVAKTEP